ncbi:MAG TPA: TolC family protein [Candidatus Binataceae bacterium]|nr:TolC family protein [Candidatus Binataceae bacterium]
MRSHLVDLAFLLACGLWACASYQPAPLQPAQSARHLAQRSLSNPQLCRYLQTNITNPPGDATCPPSHWDLTRLSLAGFFYSPTLALAQANLAVATAGIITAGQRPNPSIGLGPQYGATLAPAFTPWAIGAAELDFPIETAGKRDYRLARARALAEGAALGVGEAAWSVRQAVRSALVAELISQRNLDLARAYQAASVQIARLIQQRAAAGEIAAPAVDLALTNLANAQLKVAQAQARIPAARNQLAAAIGVPAQALRGLNLAWPGFNHPPHAIALDAARVRRLALQNSLQLRRLLTQYAADDAALKLEIARQYPNVNLGGGYSWEGNENIFELLPVITLPLMNQNQGPIAQARARRAQAATLFVAAQAQVIARANSALIDYRGALEVLNRATQAATFAQRRLAGIERAQALGDLDNLTLASAELDTIQARQAELSALQGAQSALGALEDAMQRPLESGAQRAFTLPRRQVTEQAL